MQETRTKKCNAFSAGMKSSVKILDAQLAMKSSAVKNVVMSMLRTLQKASHKDSQMLSIMNSKWTSKTNTVRQMNLLDIGRKYNFSPFVRHYMLCASGTKNTIYSS